MGPDDACLADEEQRMEAETRSQFAAQVWSKLEKQPAKPWVRLKPDDADADGIPDLDDPLPFGVLEPRL